MNARAIRWEGWELNAEASRRFHRICTEVAAALLAIALLVPLLKPAVPETPVLAQDHRQYAQLLADVRPLPAAAAPALKQPQARAPAPPAAPAPHAAARELARQSGVLALAGQLAALRDSRLDAINGAQALTAAAPAAAAAAPGDVVAGAAANSGGIGKGSAVAAVSGGGASLGNRRTGAVHSPIGFGRGAESGGNSASAGAAGRTLQEIQFVFDRSKLAFDAIFSRAARQSAGMDAGKVTVSLTIAPEGSVTHCEIISSSFGNQDFEQKLLQRVRSLNFGAKNVPPFTFSHYALDFMLA